MKNKTLPIFIPPTTVSVRVRCAATEKHLSPYYKNIYLVPHLNGGHIAARFFKKTESGNYVWMNNQNQIFETEDLENIWLL